jgi:hypothetical protein
MSTRLDIGSSHSSNRGSVTVTRNKKGSGKDPRIGTVGGSKTHENVSKTSDNDGDDNGRYERLASDGKKSETSNNRYPGKLKVDPAFVVLSPTAQEFLQAQGITSALTFIAINANDLAPAGIEWNEGAFKTIKSISDLQCWKRNVRHQWSSRSTKQGATPLSNHVAVAVLSQRPVVEEVAPTVEEVPALELGAREFEQLSSLPREPLAELKTVSSMARQFLSSQGIVTTEAFCQLNQDPWRMH